MYKRQLYASKLCSYAQGFELLHQASQHYHWDLDLGGIALLFRGGCIIRAAFLDRLAQAYRACPTLENLLLSSDFASVLTQYQSDWRDVVSTAAQCGVAVPAFSASLSYYDGLCDPAGPLTCFKPSGTALAPIPSAESTGMGVSTTTGNRLLPLGRAPSIIDSSQNILRRPTGPQPNGSPISFLPHFVWGQGVSRPRRSQRIQPL